MLDELRQEGEPIKFLDILERDKSWKCISCEGSMTKDIIFCQKCNIFRPLDMFKNILHDPKNVTEQELIFLDQRRKMEKQMILDKDISSQEVDDDLDKEDSDIQDDKYWFMISGDWLFQWKCFISNKISSSANVS